MSRGSYVDGRFSVVDLVSWSFLGPGEPFSSRAGHGVWPFLTSVVTSASAVDSASATVDDEPFDKDVIVVILVRIGHVEADARLRVLRWRRIRVIDRRRGIAAGTMMTLVTFCGCGEVLPGGGFSGFAAGWQGAASITRSSAATVSHIVGHFLCEILTNGTFTSCDLQIPKR